MTHQSIINFCLVRHGKATRYKLIARLKKWLRYRIRVTQQLENFYCGKLLGTCMETFRRVDVVSGSGAVFHKALLFSFVLKV